jgi:hypothetical protein
MEAKHEDEQTPDEVDLVHVTSVRYENVGRCFILDCDEALPIIISHLDGKGLAALASSCRTVRDLAEGDEGLRWWTRLCRTLLGKTVCAMHLQAAGGAPIADTARFWRRLYRHALHADTFHWHAESSVRAWADVHAQDEAARCRAFDSAAAAGVAGPYVARVEDREFTHSNTRMLWPHLAEDGDLATAVDYEHPDVQACRREVRRRAELTVAPQIEPDLMRAGHTSTLIDDLGIVVVVGGIMKTSIRREDGGEDLMGGIEGDIKVLVVKLPEMEVISPEVINWRTRRSSNAGVDGGDAMAHAGCTLLPTPPSRYRHSTIEARLPRGSRLSLEAFGDDGECWGNGGGDGSGYDCNDGDGCNGGSKGNSSGGGGDGGGGNGTGGGGGGGGGESNCQEGSTLLVFGGYDGSHSVWGGREILLLRVSKDGRRVRWGACDATGDAPTPCFHHTMTRLRRDLPTPRAILIGGETNDDVHAHKLAGGAVFELNLSDGEWTRRRTDGWPRQQITRWLHMAALRPEQDKYMDMYASQDPKMGKARVHFGPPTPPCRERCGEEVVILGGIGDGPYSSADLMDPWVLDVDQWRWSMPMVGRSRPWACPKARHRGAACVLGGRKMVIHGGCFAHSDAWLSDTHVLDLLTLMWKRVDVQVNLSTPKS